MRKAITTQELLHQWELMLVVLRTKIRAATGDEKQAMEVMEFTLNKCVTELRDVLGGDYPVEDLLTMMINKER